MSLELGKSFDRSYWLRLPFLTGFYNIGVFFNKRSTFLLFRVDPDFPNKIIGNKISMFKNLESSKFCETFLKLHNFKKGTLDIQNQFNGIKDEYTNDVMFMLNEPISLYKVEVDDKIFYDTLVIYGLTLTQYSSDFIFLIAERQHIDKRINRKIVRTTASQISTASSLKVLEEYHEESLVCGKKGVEKFPPIENPDIINLNDLEDST